MKIIVKAKTRAKMDKVERVGQTPLALDEIKNDLPVYKVSVKAAPVSGQANEAIIKILAEYFDVAPARVRLVLGQSNKQKVFEIL
jgi:uncharacterized protein YggU (UPF0235/DUF167 family)